MSIKGKIVSLNISEAKGTVKKPVEKAQVDKHGLVDDAHAGPWHRQVSLLSHETIDNFNRRKNTNIKPGEFAENLTLAGIDLAAVAILDRFHVNDVELEVTQIGKACHGDGCAIFQEIGTCAMPKEGLFCRVLNPGDIRTGDPIDFLPKPLNIHIVTVSDRAAAGHYADRSGPRIASLLEDYFASRRWHPNIENTIVPDDPDRLRSELQSLIAAQTDIVFTTGGTGIGPRDITPETLAPLCDKIIPGIMENIRLKYAEKIPAALLSRSLAGITGPTQLYALPGSVRAVEDYLIEILKTLEHTILMLHVIDAH